MKPTTRILDLDGSLIGQPMFRETVDASVIPLSAWGPRIRMGCSRGRFRDFARRLPSPEGLTWIGSGDFHHVTLGLIQQIQQPFQLIIIDKHPDWVRHVPLMHCGTWVAHALKLPALQRLFHFGGDLDFDNGYRWLAPWDAIQNGRARVFPAVRTYDRGTWKQISHSSLRSAPTVPLTRGRLLELLEPQRQALAEFPLMISLDKDVMRADEAIVNWDSGHLQYAEVALLLEVLRELNGRPLLGMDVVGDWSPVIMQGPLRHFLDWSEHPPLVVDPLQAAQINGAMNTPVFRQVSDWFTHGSKI